MAYQLGVAGAGAGAAARPRLTVLASASASASGEPTRRIIRRRAPPGQQGSVPVPPAQPSVAEVRRAIGVDEAASTASSREAKNSAFMDLIASTPIGQPESEPERRLREAAEWVVDATETRACEGDGRALDSTMNLAIMR
ncbi:hypothetical protein BAE44_0011567 [Dichanthelium oligosanthes]|uniref:Uncharacterized protein n=1 Tax=Dichanthelium oligosanthes TaxID=888268 RepID=A0A1E5VQK7_9POAL|nr:hypothetical protein BAE44_0011567 [Dichanthelium oligosanthes]